MDKEDLSGMVEAIVGSQTACLRSDRGEKSKDQFRDLKEINA